jgi:hypothetical protein
MSRKSPRTDRGFDTIRFDCPLCGTLCVITYRGTGRDHKVTEAPDSDMWATEGREATCESCGVTHATHQADDGRWGVLTTQFHPFPVPVEETEAGV